MKALSLTQPYATLIAIGAKKIETRSWPTSYRGELAIHASKGFPDEARRESGRSPFVEFLLAAGYSRPSSLPLGAVVAIARVIGCMPTRDILRIRRHSQGVSMLPHELDFGNYVEGRYGFFLADVRPLREPIPARGALGLWEWQPPSNLEELLLEKMV